MIQGSAVNYEREVTYCGDSSAMYVLNINSSAANTFTLVTSQCTYNLGNERQVQGKLSCLAYVHQTIADNKIGLALLQPRIVE